MAGDGDEWLGKSGTALTGWLRTFAALFHNRRALLSANESADSPYLSPLGFLLGIVGVSLVLDRALNVHPPPSELPQAVQALLSVSGVFQDQNSLYFILLTALTSVVFWVFFRLAWCRVRFRVALRHAAYNLGALLFIGTVLAGVGSAWKLVAPPVPQPAIFVATTIYWLLYVWLAAVAFLQCRDECNVAWWHAAIPFVLGWCCFVAILSTLVRYGPDRWEIVGPNMGPAVLAGDSVHIDNWIMAVRDPRVGDVMVVLPGDRSTDAVPVNGVLAGGLQSARRVIALPGDSVSEDGVDFVVNGVALVRTQTSLQHQPHAPGLAPYRVESDDIRFVIQAGPLLQPTPCLPPGTVQLQPGTYLLAFDTRRDDTSFCSIVDRSRFVGLVDWDARSQKKP